MTTLAGEISQFGVDFVAVDKSLQRRFSIIRELRSMPTVWLSKKGRLLKQKQQTRWYQSNTEATRSIRSTQTQISRVTSKAYVWMDSTRFLS
mmetsp:Transcript_34330/g.51461  ORF Transcript_34330/g.51461 Transcript_34330/m.51461 type:complete len:92 (-) Transcript_34330:329-604(-)